MTEKQIFDFFVAQGMTKEGASALEANFKEESALRPDNAQDSYKVPDAQYVAEVDAGIRNFIDQIGFGYAQWTENSRKRKFLAFAKKRGVSIADPQMQLDFTIVELQTDFPGIWELLTTSHDLLSCTQQVLYIYENPEFKNLGTRYNTAQDLFAKYANGAPVEPELPFFKPDITIMAIQALMCGNGYDIPITGYKTKEFFAKLREFVDDMEAC